MRQTSLLIIFLVVFLELVSFGIVLPTLPFYAESLGASAWQFGWLITSFAALQLVGTPLWGRFSDHFGRRPVLLVGLFGTCVALALLGLAGSLQWLFISQIVAGVCCAILPMAHAYVADVTPESDRPRAHGIVGAGYGLGFIFGPAIGGFLCRYGYPAPMFAAAALAFVNFVFALWKLEEPKLSPEIRQGNRGLNLKPEALRAAFSDRRLRLAVTVFFLATFAFSQMQTVFAFYLGSRYLFDAESVGILLSVMGLVSVLVQAGLIGRLVKRHGELKLVLAGTLLAAGAIAAAVTVPTIYLAAPLFCAVAFGQGLLRPSLSSLASLGTTSARKHGTSLALFNGSAAVAGVFGPPLAGWLYDRISWRTPFYWSSLILVLAFAVGALWYVMHTRRQLSLDKIAAGQG